MVGDVDGLWGNETHGVEGQFRRWGRIGMELAEGSDLGEGAGEVGVGGDEGDECEDHGERARRAERGGTQQGRRPA